MLNVAKAGVLAAFVPLAMALAPQAAMAQSVPSVYVSAADNDNTGNTQCRLYHGAVVSAVEQALRSNGVALGTQDDYFKDRALAMYVSVTALRGETNGGELLGNCAAYVNLEFSSATNITNPATGGKHWASVMFCNIGTLFNWSVDTIQDRTNQEVRSLTSQCLEKYRKSVR